ncbi:MAG: insulinase family protein [Ruminococcaceae bacterium]|nr:insulinase family protein [Oscillospiraceae bacterium]
MERRYYEKLDETLYETRLPNGLRLQVVPRPGSQRSVAYFVTDFGSIHRRFRLDGEEYEVPMGIAHFLEHKMFELPDRDVPAEFAALGANVNAFTSHDLTAYYFSCTRNFEASLRLLLEFVSTPYFTPESVQREQGIIDQEIAMNEDDPASREFNALMGRMYTVHPVREEILGTRDSIREITHEKLHLCHRAFYTPANMILCVVADVDPAQVAAITRQVLGDDYRPPAEKIRHWPEAPTCRPEPEQLRLDVSLPSYSIGFKCPPAGREGQALRADIVGYFAAEILFGEASPLYLKLYESGMVDSSFGGSFETMDGCAMMTCGADGDNAPRIRMELLEEAARILKEGIPREDLLRLKRGSMGRRIRGLDSPDGTCYRLCAYSLLDCDYYRFPEVYAQVTEEDVLALLKQAVTAESSALIITKPL